MLKLDLSKTAGDFHLHLQVQVAPSFVSLFGPSGSGKTTALNLISGLAKPDSGEVFLGDTCLFSSSRRVNIKPQQRRLGYIFQESRLFPHLSVQQNIQFGLNLTPAPERRFTSGEIVEICGLQALLNRMPAALSGGERQRVALARAILAAPRCLLLDEPLAALDHNARLSFLRFLRRVHIDLELPILYVSHDISNVINFADEVIILDNGRVVGHGPPKSLLDKMISEPLVASADLSNLFEVRVDSHDPQRGLTLVASEKNEFTLPAISAGVGEQLLLNIPASEIILATSEPSGLSASNILRGAVARINRLPDRVFVEIDAGEKYTVEIVEATVQRLSLAAGKEIFLIVKASSFRRLSGL